MVHWVQAASPTFSFRQMLNIPQAHRKPGDKFPTFNQRKYFMMLLNLGPLLGNQPQESTGGK